MCTLGGVDYAWGSWQIIGLAVLAIALIVAFVVVERRASEPVLPPRLFSNAVFSVTSGMGLVVGFALFGSVTYLPLFLQVVNGASPTGSGLQILPLMGGLLITSIGSGQAITRTGRYKPFPIVGTAVMVVGLFLLSTMDASTSKLMASAFMFVLGLGLGLVMQVLVLAVQNAVDYKDLGVATSGATLFRSIGGSVGTAVLGSIFSNRLNANIASTLPASAAHVVSGGAGTANPAALAKLPPTIHHLYISAFTDALSTVFVVAAAVAAAAFVLSWLLPQKPLRDSVSADSSGITEALAVPRPGTSIAEASRALSVLIGRERRKELVERLAERAGVDLSAAASWLIVRLHENPAADLTAVADEFDVPLEVAQRGLAELLDRGLITVTENENDSQSQVRRTPTPEGEEIAQRLIAERRASLARLCEGWAPDQHPDLAGLLTRMARELAADPPPRVGAPA